MPLTHVTGVNLIGKFNDTNTTSVETLAEIRDSLSKKEAGKATVSASDYRNYRNFWSIQKYFNNPFLVSFCPLILQIFSAEPQLDFEEPQDAHEDADIKSEESFAEVLSDNDRK